MSLLESDARTVKALFGLLMRTPAHQFPDVSSLSHSLANSAPNVPGDIQVDSHIAKKFATASVDAWLRSVHSFLVSSALTESSPIWASVAGYYASHYAIRSLAHLLGYFCLYKRKYIVKIRYEGGIYYCNYYRKGASDREHKSYWKILNSLYPFSNDPLFPLNPADAAPSDVAHRDRANYADHLHKHYSRFKILDESITKERIDKISKIAFSQPPIPNRSKFTDIDSVQIVSYHRIVYYRRLLDEIVSERNRFWSVNRDPSFATGFINYQLVEAPVPELG